MTEHSEVSRAVVPPGQMNRASMQLIERMKDGKPGDEHTDAQAKDICGKDVRPRGANGLHGDGYGYMQTAIRYCRNVYGVIWKRVRGEGKIACLNGPECRAEATSKRRHIHRTGKVAMRILGVVDRRELTEEQQREHLIEVACMGTTVQATSSKIHRQLASDKNPQPLNMPKLLAAMRENGES